MDCQLGVRRASGWGDWWQEATVDGVLYLVGRLQGRRVRMAYCGKFGHRWTGVVREKATSKEVWSEDVAKSMGVKTMLQLAGVLSYTGLSLLEEKALVEQLTAYDLECRVAGPLPNRSFDWVLTQPRYLAQCNSTPDQERAKYMQRDRHNEVQRDRPYNLDDWNAKLAQLRPKKCPDIHWERFLKVHGLCNRSRTWLAVPYDTSQRDRGWSR